MNSLLKDGKMSSPLKRVESSGDDGLDRLHTHMKICGDSEKSCIWKMLYMNEMNSQAGPRGLSGQVLVNDPRIDFLLCVNKI